MWYFIIFMLTIIVISILFTFIAWAIHISMVKELCKTYKWVTYRKFKRELLKLDDDWNHVWITRQFILSSKRH